MKRFVQFTLCLAVLCTFGVQIATAQKKFSGNANGKPVEVPVVYKKCGTDEALEQRYKNEPEFRAMMDQREKEFQVWRAANAGSLNNIAARTSLLTSPVTIPIVFHIVLPNPNVVKDVDVEYVVNRLNLDFSGNNPDSTNGVNWYSVRGRSLIRFCLARRDPAGNFTNGIERKVGTTVIAGGEPQPIKNAATVTGGFNPWDVTRFYNVWVGDGGPSGLLGIAPAIGPGTAASDGVCVAFNAFSNNPCNTIPQFALGRTLVHEIGHNFGLYHTFQGGCADGDNANITTPGCSFPAAIMSLPDQSPALSTSTSGCPTGSVAAGCASSPNPPGKQYQNYMDYTDDPCYSMYNKTQVERMHHVLEVCRVGYLTSNGCAFPVGFTPLDASVTAVIAPGGGEMIGCNFVTYPAPTCPGAVIPRVAVTNQGSTVLTSVTISHSINGGAPVVGTYTVNLAYGQTATVILNAVSAVVGVNTLSIVITNANGVPDVNVANNTISANFTVVAPTPLPRSADFTGGVVPPPNFTNVNVAGTGTVASWVYNAAGNTNIGSAGFNAWSLGTGNIRDLRSTSASFNAIPSVADSIIVTFDVAHRQYFTTNDRLTLLYSLDCGQTFLPTGYDRLSNVLATELPSSGAQYTTPTVWRRERVALKNAAIEAGGVIQFAFRGTSAFGNWIYLDNINIAIPVNRDLQVTTISVPGTDECSGTFTPAVIVRNNGLQATTQYQVGYRVDAGAVATTGVITTPLAPGASATITLPVSAGNAVGPHVIRAFTFNLATASGAGDQNAFNDTLNKNFTVRVLAASPLQEGFETTAFAPLGWAIVNPNNNNTWTRFTAAGGFGNSPSSAKIDNFSANFTGQTDDLVSVPTSTAGGDSLVISFDLAHKNYPGYTDVLSVRISRDCGNTFTPTTYSKGGALLATAGSSTADYTPIAGDWKRESVTVAILGANSMLASFRNLANFGNNIYIDNINLEVRYKRDITPSVVVRPNGFECSGSFTPSVTIRNNGYDIVNGFTTNYQVDGGAVVTNNFTGLTLAPGASASYNLAPVTGLAVGAHNISIFTTNLVTNGGTGDQFVQNDTITRIFTVVGTSTLPLTEGFENVLFAPTGWGINNPDGNITWSKASVGFNSPSSAVIRNFDYASAAATGLKVDDLATPITSYAGVDSVYLSFDYAALTKIYPGATSQNLDTLEVLATRDCGVTFSRIWSKWGEDLQTINDPNYSNAFSFLPGNDAWKNVKLNVTGASGTTATGLQFFFRNKSNGDNNIYIDNVNISTLRLPARLKQQGYILYPSPFTGSFNIQHFLTPTDLRYIEVYDAKGRLVYRKQYGSTGANATEGINLKGEAAGMYVVKIGYTNKQIVERIIKTNN